MFAFKEHHVKKDSDMFVTVQTVRVQHSLYCIMVVHYVNVEKPSPSIPLPAVASGVRIPGSLLDLGGAIRNKTSTEVVKGVFTYLAVSGESFQRDGVIVEVRDADSANLLSLSISRV